MAQSRQVTRFQERKLNKMVAKAAARRAVRAALEADRVAFPRVRAKPAPEFDLAAYREQIAKEMPAKYLSRAARVRRSLQRAQRYLRSRRGGV